MTAPPNPGLPPIQPLEGMLFAAVQAQNLPVVKDLLARGADPNDSGPSGNSALRYAAEAEGAELVRALLDAGAEIDFKNSSGCTALVCAVLKNNTLAARLLLARGANPDLVTDQGRTPLGHATGDDRAAVRAVLEDRAQWTEPPVSEKPFTASNVLSGLLGWAVHNNNLPVVEELLRHGADVNETIHGNTVLLASIFNNVAMTRALLEAGADVDLRPAGPGQTPLIGATIRREPEIVRLLLEAGADMSLQDKSGKSAFDWAHEKNHWDIAALLEDEPARREAARAAAVEEAAHEAAEAARLRQREIAATGRDLLRNAAQARAGLTLR